MKLKNLAVLVVSLFCVQMSFAGDAVNIAIKLTGTKPDNRFFLCEPNIGCLSVLAAQRGKVYPVFYSFQMNNLYLDDIANLRYYALGLPDSCNVNLETNQTINIYGNIVENGQNVRVDNLHCTVTNNS